MIFISKILLANLYDFILDKLIIDIIFAPSFAARSVTDLVAQLVEHLPFKERVLGSSPSQITILLFFIAQVLELVDRHG